MSREDDVEAELRAAEEGDKAVEAAMDMSDLEMARPGCRMCSGPVYSNIGGVPFCRAHFDEKMLVKDFENAVAVYHADYTKKLREGLCLYCTHDGICEVQKCTNATGLVIGRCKPMEKCCNFKDKNPKNDKPKIEDYKKPAAKIPESKYKMGIAPFIKEVEVNAPQIQHDSKEMDKLREQYPSKTSIMQQEDVYSWILEKSKDATAKQKNEIKKLMKQYSGNELKKQVTMTLL